MDKKTKTVIKAAVPLLAALLSVFIILNYASSAEHYPDTIASLNEKQTTVAELTAAATAASAAVSLIPGDAGTPIAEKLADFSSYFLIVFSAIFLEKYLLTITGVAAFKYLIPIGCALLAVYVFCKRDVLRNIAAKLIVFGIAIVLIIPVSVRVSDLIDDTYEESIQETIDAAKDTSEIAEGSTEEKETGLIDSIISGIQNTTSGVTEKAQNVLNNFIEALAVMIVTSCVIPILIILMFAWLSKLILGADLSAAAKRIRERS